MSYCRKGEDSDVYVFPHVDGFLMCYACSLKGPVDDAKSFHTQYRRRMCNHLQEHILDGDIVPLRVFERLEKEIQELGNRIIPVGSDEEESE